LRLVNAFLEHIFANLNNGAHPWKDSLIVTTDSYFPVTDNTPRLAVIIPSLEGGGAERVVINLLNEFSIKHHVQVDLIVFQHTGALLNEVPKSVTLHNLNSRRAATSIFKLYSYLYKSKPTAILSHLAHTNILSSLVRLVLWRRPRLYVVDHIPITQYLGAIENPIIKRLHLILIKLLYPLATRMFSVSSGIREELAELLPRSEHKIFTIYNPITPISESHEPSRDTATIIPKGRFILGLGRLVEQKNFGFLIRAVAPVLEEKTLNLLIAGVGPQKSFLKDVARQSGVEHRVFFLGYVEDPSALIQKADVLALASLYEGLPTVLIEALAFGTQIVSTDCKTGPTEILCSGKYGWLSPIGDFAAFRENLTAALDRPLPKQHLQTRARDFDRSTSATRYLELMCIPRNV